MIRNLSNPNNKAKRKAISRVKNENHLENIVSSNDSDPTENLSVSGRIARNIAHEVRNPLTNIHLAIEQIKLEYNNIDEGLEMYLEMINRNAIRINNLVSEFLNASKPFELNKNIYSIKRLIEESLELVNPLILEKNIEIEKVFENHLLDLNIDTEKIKIMFTNILLNAIEAVTNNGKVKVEVFTHAENCIISISDNGIGINPQDLPRVFEPFFSKKNNTRGLGLTAVQNIANGHNARIDISSISEKGTTVTLIFNSTQPFQK